MLQQTAIVKISCHKLLAFILVLNVVKAQLANDPQTYQPRYNPQYTNTQQNPQTGTTKYENPLLTSIQEQQKIGGTSAFNSGGILGQQNYNNFYDSQTNINRNIGVGNKLGIQTPAYDAFNRNLNKNTFTSTGPNYLDVYTDELNYCPEHWISFRQTCYRFIRSPKRNWNDAKKICKAYNAELLNVDNVEKHSFILKQLILQNQRQNRFWTSAHQTGPNSWSNDDGTAFLIIEDSFSFDEEQAIENEDLHDNRFLGQNNEYNNRNNPNQYYNTIGGSANRNQNNLRGFIGEYTRNFIIYILIKNIILYVYIIYN